MFERDHAEPLEYQLGLRRGAGALHPALPRHRHLSRARRDASPPTAGPPRSLERADPVPGAGRRCSSRSPPRRSRRSTCCARRARRTSGAPALPYVPGVQGVGVVRAGPAELVGRRVWFPTTAGMAPGDGSLAELAVARAAEAVVVDADLPDTAVAALGLSAVAAWEVLERPGRAARRRDGARARRRRGRRPGRGAGGPPARGRPRRRGGPLARGAGAGPPHAVRMPWSTCAPTTTPPPWPSGCARRATAPPTSSSTRSPASRARAAALVLAEGGRLVNLGSTRRAGPVGRLRGPAQPVGRGARLHQHLPHRRAPQAVFATVLEHAARGRLEVDHDVVPLDGAPAAWDAVGARHGIRARGRQPPDGRSPTRRAPPCRPRPRRPQGVPQRARAGQRAARPGGVRSRARMPRCR